MNDTIINVVLIAPSYPHKPVYSFQHDMSWKHFIFAFLYLSIFRHFFQLICNCVYFLNSYNYLEAKLEASNEKDAAMKLKDAYSLEVNL